MIFCNQRVCSEQLWAVQPLWTCERTSRASSFVNFDNLTFLISALNILTNAIRCNITISLLALGDSAAQVLSRIPGAHYKKNSLTFFQNDTTFGRERCWSSEMFESAYWSALLLRWAKIPWHLAALELKVICIKCEKRVLFSFVPKRAS